jgi:hypothetical protein
VLLERGEMVVDHINWDRVGGGGPRTAVGARLAST